MTDAYQNLARREKALADELAQDAYDKGLSVLSNSLSVAATAAVKSALKDDGKGSVSEPASDLRALRTDPLLQMAKTKDLGNAYRICHKSLVSALKDGYEYDAKERSKIIVSESTGLKISVDLTEQELNDLESFPIVGLTAKEWSDRARYNLSCAIDQALSAPLTGAFDVSVIPGKLSEASKGFATSVASLVKESFFSGGKAAMLALRDALPKMKPHRQGANSP